MIPTDDLLRAIAHNAYELYSNTTIPMTPAQREINEFMCALKPGYWVVETSSQRQWRHQMLNSIGRLIWCGKLPVYDPDWRGEAERPLDIYTLLQLADGNFSWWWNASFIRVFSGNSDERRSLSGLFVSSERKSEAQEELDEQNLSWAKCVLRENGLSTVLDEHFETIILDYAQKYYDEKVNKDWHPWNVLSLFPVKEQR